VRKRKKERERERERGKGGGKKDREKVGKDEKVKRREDGKERQNRERERERRERVKGFLRICKMIIREIEKKDREQSKGGKEKFDRVREKGLQLSKNKNNSVRGKRVSDWKEENKVSK
jgi:hypothetical protein